MVVVSIPDGDVTPLVLPETSEEIVVPVDALGVGGPDADVALGELEADVALGEQEADVNDDVNADVGEGGMAMATEIRVQVEAQVRRAVCTLVLWLSSSSRIPHPPSDIFRLPNQLNLNSHPNPHPNPHLNVNARPALCPSPPPSP